MKIYESISEITIFCFYKILETNNYTYLYKKKKHRTENNSNDNLFVAWTKIYDEYILKVKDNVSQKHFSLIDEIHFLEKRYDILKAVIESISEYNKIVFGKILKDFGVIFNDKDVVSNQIESLKRQLKASKNKLRRRKSELELIKSEEKTEVNIIKEKIQIQQITGMKIDIHKDTMEEYIEMKKMAEDISKQRSKSSKNYG